MDASRERKAIHAARRAYKSAMALGAEERIALMSLVRLTAWRIPAWMVRRSKRSLLPNSAIAGRPARPPRLTRRRGATAKPS
jgi:Ser/Thr protein kinase RdoA (MazF antagonist)